MALALGGLAGAQDTLNAAEVCAASPQVDGQGYLVWGANGQEAKAAPYDLTCPKLHIWTQGNKVMVQAEDVFKAMQVFTEDSFFMSYFADLRVRYEKPGEITADPVRDLGGSLLDDIFKIKVTVTPKGGEAHTLLKNTLPYPLKLPADQAFTVKIDAADLPNPWPQIEFDPAQGLVIATLGQ